jgi:hypothetical protein
MNKRGGVLLGKVVRLLVPVAALGLLTTLTISANAAVDTTPPVWKKPVTASIPIGAALRGPSNPLWCDSTPTDEYTLGVNLDYRAVDPESGIDHYVIGGTFDYEETTATRTGYIARTYTGHDCGGGSNAINIEAYNGAGLDNEGGGYGDGTLHITQDTPGAAVTYSGRWGTSKCACWSDGTTHKTIRKGAAVTYRIVSPVVSNAGHRIDNAPYALGLVMAKGPDRGAAKVLIDGTKVGTVNTYSTTKLNGTVVWRQTMTPGSHTLRIVNRATAGHPRIDIDAFVLLRKYSPAISVDG